MNLTEDAEHVLNWNDEERAAEAMIPIIGTLYREDSVEVSVFGQLMVKRTVNDIIKAHDLANRSGDATLSVRDTLVVLQHIQDMALKHVHVDIGKLAVRHAAAGQTDVAAFLQTELAGAIEDSAQPMPEPKDVVLFGFGRIGRLVARLLSERMGGSHGARLRAIVVRKGKGGNDLEKRASLLRFDSVHGPFNGVIDVDVGKQAMIINGQYVQVIYSDDPATIDYGAHDIHNAVVVDNTGAWRDDKSLSRHLEAKGVDRVLLTAPGKGNVKNIVHGINQDMIGDDDRILSAASCTTNAIAPVLKSLDEKFGIQHGHMETIHSYTNDQNLIDNYHKADRRGRGAPLNMVLTSTGATQAVGKALPELAGKLTGSSVRVPTPNVSLAILSLSLDARPDAEAVNSHLHYIAVHSDLQKQVGYSDAPDAASSDFVGKRNAGIVDARATQAGDGRCVVYVWYDNEFGYTCQVVRILRQITQSTLPAFPAG